MNSSEIWPPGMSLPNLTAIGEELHRGGGQDCVYRRTDGRTTSSFQYTLSTSLSRGIMMIWTFCFSMSYCGYVDPLLSQQNCASFALIHCIYQLSSELLIYNDIISYQYQFIRIPYVMDAISLFILVVETWPSLWLKITWWPGHIQSWCYLVVVMCSTLVNWSHHDLNIWYFDA